jgi:hypothetical protein
MAVLLWGDFDASRLRGLAKKTRDGPHLTRARCTTRQPVELRGMSCKTGQFSKRDECVNQYCYPYARARGRRLQVKNLF